MIIGNKKPLVVIGYTESSMTDEFVQAINETSSCEVITPLDFYSIKEKSEYQYIVSITFDRAERLETIYYLQNEGLDLFTVIHDSCITANEPASIIGPGSFVFPNVIICLAAGVGKNCIIGAQAMIGHYSSLGDNCLLRPGTMILGKSKIGNNCILNARTTVVNSVQVADDVEIGACSYVRKDIKVSGKYGGNPIRKLKD